MSQGISNLSKEQLLELLLQKEKMLRQKEDALTQKERKLQFQQGQIAELQECNKKLTQENEELRAEKVIAGESIEDYLNTTKEVFEQCSRTFSFETKSQADLLKGLGQAMNAFFSICRSNKTLVQAFIKGNEKLGAKASRKKQNEINNRIKKQVSLLGKTVIEKGTLKIAKEIGLLEKCAAASGQQSGKSEIERDIRDALSRQGHAEEVSNNPSKGKAARDENLPSKVLEDNEFKAPCACSKCGEPMKEVGNVSVTLRSFAVRLNDIAVSLEENKKIFCCPKGHYQVLYSPEAEIPVLPQRTISVKSLLETCDMQVKGIPVNKIKELFFKGCQIGGQTIYTNIADMYKLYLKPLEEAIRQRMASNEVVLLDETHYQCLQQQGKGSSKPIENPTKSSSLILACRSPVSSALPFVWYAALPTRSTASIQKALGEDMKVQVIITDAYGGYDSLLKTEAFENCNQQICLYHFRRKCLADLGYESLESASSGMEADKVDSWLNSKIEQLDPRMILLAVLRDLSAISEKENSLHRKEGELEKDYAIRVDEVRNGPGQNCRFYMDRIDRMMQQLCESQLVIKKDRYESAPAAMFSASCIYYMNQRSQMRTFLDDYRVCCHTNDVERAIRSLTILRKNACFSQSIDGLNVLCGLQSIWETAKACGIKDVTGWLIEYTRKLSEYCEGNAWTEEAEKGNVPENPDRQLRINWEQRWSELSKGFDFEKYYPWNYSLDSER